MFTAPAQHLNENGLRFIKMAVTGHLQIIQPMAVFVLPSLLLPGTGNMPIYAPTLSLVGSVSNFLTSLFPPKFEHIGHQQPLSFSSQSVSQSVSHH